MKKRIVSTVIISVLPMSAVFSFAFTGATVNENTSTSDIKIAVIFFMLYLSPFKSPIYNTTILFEMIWVIFTD